LQDAQQLIPLPLNGVFLPSLLGSSKSINRHTTNAIAQIIAKNGIADTIISSIVILSPCCFFTKKPQSRGLSEIINKL